jgi:hypothetical protein
LIVAGFLAVIRRVSGYRFQVARKTKYRLPVAGYLLQGNTGNRLPVPCRIQVAGYKVQVAGENQIQVTSCRLPVAGKYREQVAGSMQDTSCRLQGTGCRENQIQVTGCQLPVAGKYREQVAGSMQDTSCRLQGTGCRGKPNTGYQLPVTSWREIQRTGFRLQGQQPFARLHSLISFEWKPCNLKPVTLSFE